MAFSSEELLAVAAASPDAAGRRDKKAWLDLFAATGEVEDPVGSLTCRKDVDGRLGRFFDTFIAPTEIRFDVHQDIVDNDTVLRDVTIHTRFPSGAALAVPAHVIYGMVREGGAVRIGRLAAHWELLTMIVAMFSCGFRGIATMVALSWRMLRVQGVRGYLSYTKALFTGVSRHRGRALARAAIAAINARDDAAWARLCCRDNPLAFPGVPDGMTFETERVIVCGWTATVGLHAAGRRIGVLLLDIAPADGAMAGARLLLTTATG